MSQSVSALALLLAAHAALAGGLKQPAAPPMKPVSETLYGRQLTDPYRYFEAQDAGVVNWIKAQGAYTRALFDSTPAHAALVRKLAAFEDQFTALKGYQRFGGRELFLEEGSSNYDLMVRDARDVRCPYRAVAACQTRSEAARLWQPDSPAGRSG